MLFRLMTKIDLDRILEVEQSAYPIPWTRSVFEDSFINRNECWVLELDGLICGHAIISAVLDEIHLLNLCVDPLHSRRGLGRAFLRHLICRAGDRKATVFFLEVRASNQSAINLYFSEGFNEVGIRPSYYPAENGREDALLMTLDLTIDLHV